MKHKFFIAVFTLCLAVTLTMIPARASQAPQGEATESVASVAEETAAAGDEITSTDHEEGPESKIPNQKKVVQRPHSQRISPTPRKSRVELSRKR